MAVAWPKVKAKLAASWPALLPGVNVYDGPVITGENPPAALTIAWTPSLEEPTAGTFAQSQAEDGWAATEQGTILCELSAVTGYTQVPDVWTTFDLIASWVQADQTLGGTLSQGSTCSIAANVLQSQTTAGAAQRLILTVSYFTRI